MTFKIVSEFPDERIVDMFIVACEGGSNYWCGCVDPLHEGKDAYWAMLKGFRLHDKITNLDFFVHPPAIQEAFQLFSTECPQGWTDFLNGDADAEAADCFLQLCAFKEVLYG